MVASLPPSLRDAYARCDRIARSHYENFPVASRLLPPGMRPHVAAIYAFARTADDFADEGDRPADERLALIAAWRRRLRAVGAGDRDPLDDEHREVFVALGHTIASCRLPIELLEDLLSAFAQDVTVTRYRTWADVMDYCRRSANPVGRLVLRVAGYRDAALDASSDALCTALQLTNFWQDLARDWRRGRLYVPLDDAGAVGATPDGFDPFSLSPEWRCALERAAERTAALFDEGRAVCEGVRGRLRLELRLTWLGGSTILERLVASGFRVAEGRPTIVGSDLPVFFWRALTWRAAAAR